MTAEGYRNALAVAAKATNEASVKDVGVAKKAFDAKKAEHLAEGEPVTKPED